ncbi:hypothetical protein HGM15179_013827, partial [Zosterops borbonicus]
HDLYNPLHWRRKTWLFFLKNGKLCTVAANCCLWEWWALCTNPKYRAFGQKWEEWPILLWAALQKDLN